MGVIFRGKEFDNCSLFLDWLTLPPLLEIQLHRCMNFMKLRQGTYLQARVERVGHVCWTARRVNFLQYKIQFKRDVFALKNSAFVNSISQSSCCPETHSESTVHSSSLLQESNYQNSLSRCSNTRRFRWLCHQMYFHIIFYYKASNVWTIQTCGLQCCSSK